MSVDQMVFDQKMGSRLEEGGANSKWENESALIYTERGKLVETWLGPIL